MKKIGKYVFIVLIATIGELATHFFPLAAWGSRKFIDPFGDLTFSKNLSFKGEIKEDL